jgi:putative addiction module component
MAVMSTTLELDSMSVEEKLEAMEALWADLCRHEDKLPVYEWQKEILNERQERIASGKTRFIDWEEAKSLIDKETS